MLELGFIVIIQNLKILNIKFWTLNPRYMETVDEFRPDVDFPAHMLLNPKVVEWGTVTAAKMVIFIKNLINGKGDACHV